MKPYTEIVREVLEEYGAIKPSVGEIEVEVIADDTRGHYELMYAGWIGPRRVHGVVIHIDVRGREVWIQHDGTSVGVANDLIARGIPESDIVYAWHAPESRARASAAGDATR